MKSTVNKKKLLNSGTGGFIPLGMRGASIFLSYVGNEMDFQQMAATSS
jgi:hypothetical protein